MDHPNEQLDERLDLPLEFDTDKAEAETNATEAIAAAGVRRPDAPPMPEPKPEPETAAPHRPTPLIAARRRQADSLTTQNISEEQRAAVRTVPASALPGARPETTRRPPIQYGRMLAEQRKRLNLTVNEVDNATLIRSDYIEALEHEDLDHLPPPVFVVAYVRKLGRYYKLPPEKIEELVGELKQHLEYSVPEELITRLEDSTEPCEENTRTMKRLLLIMGIAVPVLVLSIVIAVLLASGNGKNAPAAGGERMPESRIRHLLEKPVLEIPELPAR